MNELQLALIGAGVLAVVGVWGYNKWQERQHRRLAEKIFKGGQPDVLLGDDAPAAGTILPGEAAKEVQAAKEDSRERIEPAIGSLEADLGTPPAAAGEQALPPAAVDEAAPRAAPPRLPPEYADELADCVVRIEFPEPLPGAGLWAIQARWAGNVQKPLTWVGLDEAAAAWHKLSADDGGRYRTVCAALQLADRRGAVSDADLTAFLDGVREMVVQCAGVARLPDFDEVLMGARRLDDFCASVDLQLGVNIVAVGEPFPGTKLRGLLEAAGLTLFDDGCFHALDEGGKTRFVVCNAGPERFLPDSMKSLATQGVTLSLDVPRVASGPAVFDAMIAVGEQLANTLGGTMVDAHGNRLTPEMLDGIRTKVAEIQDRMARQDIEAGSVRALRLFS